jgi:hypothetical protein
MFFLLLLFRSSSRDYQADAESYLRSVGRETEIESIMPKSESAKKDDAMSTKQEIISLRKKTEELENRLAALEAAASGATNPTNLDFQEEQQIT